MVSATIPVADRYTPTSPVLGYQVYPGGRLSSLTDGPPAWLSETKPLVGRRGLPPSIFFAAYVSAQHAGFEAVEFPDDADDFRNGDEDRATPADWLMGLPGVPFFFPIVCLFFFTDRHLPTTLGRMPSIPRSRLTVQRPDM